MLWLWRSPRTVTNMLTKIVKVATTPKSENMSLDTFADTTPADGGKTRRLKKADLLGGVRELLCHPLSMAF
jgi:hypothetical protein